MVQDLIRYDLLVQDAMRKVIGKVLRDVASDGLPGEHHFYISFRTDVPGTRISNAMRQKYPHDMMIALQYQFRDLAVYDTYFEVVLSFSGIPEKLVVPFDAITTFYDPSVQFALNFQPDIPDESGEKSEESDHMAEVTPLHRQEAEKPKKAEHDSQSEITEKNTKDRKSPQKPAKVKEVSSGKKDPEKVKVPEKETAKEKKTLKAKVEKDSSAGTVKKISSEEVKQEAKQDQGAEIVRLDAFRKKRE